MHTDPPPLLVFFTSRRSGPARRMESLIAHLARKERGQLDVKKVDIDERPDIARRLRVDEAPALLLLKDRRVIARIDGRATTPRIEKMLGPHLRVGV